VDTKTQRIPILIAWFDTEIHQFEVPAFRGAVIHSMANANVLFHNHQDEKLRYAYPLIQYKRIHNKAATVCLNGGTEAIGEFFSRHDVNVKIGPDDKMLEINRVDGEFFRINTWETKFTYQLRRWLPLNQSNYGAYKQLDGIAERCALLERMLVGNILSMASGLNIHFDKQVTMKLLDIKELNPIKHKGVKMQPFDVRFSTNVSIPNYIGLGKGVSMGFGMVTTVRQSTTTQFQHNE